MDDMFTYDLESWLGSLSDDYVVDKVLKNSATEMTEVVYRRDGNGNPIKTPSIRKRFALDEGLGTAYKLIQQAQEDERRLSHQPFIEECRTVGNMFEVVMQYVNGPTLAEAAQAQGPGLALAQRVFPQLCDAVTELHTSFDQPLIHRDIKPSNVMFNGQVVVLIDLGIARTYNAEATRDTVRYGTPGYAPPEQYGYGQTSVLSDVYALGMTLAFCFTGEEPTATLRERKFDDWRIPPAVQEVLVRATEFDPQRRHQSAQALRDDFLRAAKTSERREPLTFGERVLSGEALVVLGRIWNVLLGAVWLLLMVGTVQSTIEPHGTSARVDMPLRVFLFTLVSVIPFTALGYALLDKRRIRKHSPFSAWGWRKETIVCLCITIVSFALAVVFIGIFVPRA